MVNFGNFAPDLGFAIDNNVNAFRGNSILINGKAEDSSYWSRWPVRL
jgi:hypothetical protein